MDNGLYPLTYPQRSVWHMEQFCPGTGLGNVCGLMRIKGDIDYASLKKALKLFIQNHDALRLRMVKDGAQPLQYPAEYREPEIDCFDFSSSTAGELESWLRRAAETPFNLLDAELYYFAVVKISSGEGGFLVKLHHTVADAWTMTLLGSQVFRDYANLKHGRRVESRLQPSYLEYVRAQQEYAASPEFAGDRQYWAEKFSTVPEFVSFQDTVSRPADTGARLKVFTIPEETGRQVYGYCRENNISVFHLFFSALLAYISRITSRRDIVLGTAFMDRRNRREKNTAGMFVYTFPLRHHVDPYLGFTDLARQVSAETRLLLRKKHYRYPYEYLVRDFRQRHGTSINLLDIMLSYQNARFNMSNFAEYGVETEWLYGGSQLNSLTLNVSDREDTGNLNLEFSYLPVQYTGEEINRMYGHLLTLLRDAVNNPARKVSRLELLTTAEKQQLLPGWNNAAPNVNAGDKTIHRRFEEQAAKTPGRTAVIYGDRHMTYAELNQKASGLARQLRKKGLRPGSVAAIMAYRSPELVAALLGVLKAGGAFLNIDPGYPGERVKYMLRDSGTGVLLTSKGLGDELAFSGEIVYIDSGPAPAVETGNLPRVNTPRDPAYVIYTSGSTGRPKGVMVEHASLNNFVAGIREVMDYTAPGRVLAANSTSFDIFLHEVIPTLVYGLTLVIAGEDQHRDPALLKAILTEKKVDTLLMTPSRARLLLDYDGEFFKPARQLLLGGEAFPRDLLERLRETTRARIINGYGPAETTIGASFKDLTGGGEINTGRPLANVRIYILDEHLNPVPANVPGEICIGGAGVARGYLGKPELTAEKFVADPFVPGARIYRTGDTGRLTPGGEIEFLGRADQQVKIRGFRVETGEIEDRLLTHEKVSAAAVTVNKDEHGTGYLCAYFVSGSKLPGPELRNYLSGVLPGYMIPSRFVQLENMPLTPNGKIDRGALPEPGGNSEPGVRYDLPSRDTEQKLAAAWAQALGLARVGVNDNFFELGGDSYAVIKVLAALKPYNWNLTAGDFYMYPVLGELASRVKAGNGGSSGTENLVLLRRGTGNEHFFFVHAGVGDIEAYIGLCLHLGRDFHYWGIKAGPPGDYEAGHISLPRIAAGYAEQIKAIQPEGPYNIAGWSLGGTIAYEIARQLEQQGDSISFLGLIDSAVPGVRGRESRLERKLLRAVAGNGNTYTAGTLSEDFISTALQTWQELAPGQIKDLLPEEIKLAVPRLEEAGTGELLHYIKLMWNLNRARAGYAPPAKINAPVYFFKAARRTKVHRGVVNPLRWQQYCRQLVNVYLVEGDHYSMFKEPHLAKLAEKLDGILRQNGETAENTI